MPPGGEVHNFARGTRLGAALDERWQLNGQIVSDIRIGPSKLQQLFSSVVCDFVRLKLLDNSDAAG